MNRNHNSFGIRFETAQRERESPFQAKDKTAASLSGKAMITIKWSDSKEKGRDAKVGAWSRKGDTSASL